MGGCHGRSGGARWGDPEEAVFNVAGEVEGNDWGQSVEVPPTQGDDGRQRSQAMEATPSEGDNGRDGCPIREVTPI